jgi:glycosyltransferase involved in cell wall biosynthesis
MEACLTTSYRLLSVLMPIYNESRTLRTIVGRVLSAPCPVPIELICVDDCSRDNSWEILRELAAADPRVRIFRHEKNAGKAAAIHTAVTHVTGDIVLIQDADLEYDPRDFAALLAPIVEGKADAVFGSRFAFSGQRRVLLFWHAVANRVLTLLTNMFLDLNLTDMETCYKAVRADILLQTPLRAQRFGIEPEITARLAQWGIRIYEVPISYHGRTAAEGKKIGFKDAIEALTTLIRCCFLDTRFTTNEEYFLLQTFRRTRRVSRWDFDKFRPFVGSRVLETGCGIGNFAELLLDRPRLICADGTEFFVEMTRRRFGHLENIRVLKADIGDPSCELDLRDERIDTVVCLNMLEHIDHEAPALKRFYDLLEPGGKLIVMVPANPALMSPCDKALGHRRRYSRESLCAVLTEAGFKINHVSQYNTVGAWAWKFNKWRGRAALTARQIKLFQWLLPVVKAVDAMNIGSGLSLLAVGEK